ncbi:hypothetical protein [Streptomyces sp. NPDC058664]|uniref:hypothetical protein n=1 Tax=unclassified Streptomyces TaxID=2593676 RepID=UPI003667010F
MKSAYQWHQLWRASGVQALASRGPSGSRCRLSPRCLEKLVVYLEQGLAAHGCGGPGGTASRVDADRQEVPHHLQRLRGHVPDAPARLHPAGPRPTCGRA